MTQPTDPTAISSFLASFSHRLSQPVTALLGTLQVALLKTQSPADYQAALAEAVELTEQITRLIRLLGELAVPRIIPGGVESTPLGEVIGDVAEDLRPWAEARGVKVTGGGFSGISVKANVQMLRVVLAKVFSNAIRRSPRDGTVRATLSESDGVAVVSITDEGRSLSADEAAATLDPFEKSRPGIRRLEETHLEWAIAAQITRRMQGSMSLEPVGPQGCCCCVRLLIAPPGASSTQVEGNASP